MNRKLTWMSILFGASVFIAGALLRERIPPLTMGTSAGFPPFEMRAGGEGSAIVGFDVDLGRAIAKKVGRPLKIVDLPFEGLIPALEAGAVEMVLAGLAMTEERATRVDFSEPYFRTSPVVLMREEMAPPESKEAMAGRKVGAQGGTTSYALAQEIAGAENVVESETPWAAMGDLLNGKVDFMLMDAQSAAVFLKTFPGSRMARLPFAEVAYGVAVRKGDSKLLAKINATLEEIVKDGRRDAWVKQWMGQPD